MAGLVWFGFVLAELLLGGVVRPHVVHRGGGKGGYGPMLHMDGIRPEPCGLFFKSRGYLVTEKGTL